MTIVCDKMFHIKLFSQINQPLLWPKKMLRDNLGRFAHQPLYTQQNICSGFARELNGYDWWPKPDIIAPSPRERLNSSGKLSISI